MLNATNAGERDDKIVILEFDDTASFKRWYNSPEYQKILPTRLDNSTARSLRRRGRQLVVKI